MTEQQLYCDHMGCPNGCTTRSGMCEACIRVLLEQQARVIAGLVDNAGHTASCHFSSCTCGTVRKFADALLEANRLLRGGAIVRTKALSPTPNEPPNATP